MIDNRFNTAALAATSTERNTASSSKNDSTITAAMKKGSRAEMLSVWSTYAAVIPPTTTLMSRAGESRRDDVVAQHDKQFGRRFVLRARQRRQGDHGRVVRPGWRSAVRRRRRRAVARASARSPTSVAMVFGVAVVGDEHERAVEAGAEAFRHQVVGAASGEVGRVVACIGEAETQVRRPVRSERRVRARQQAR